MGFDTECILQPESVPGEYYCPLCRQLVHPGEVQQTQCGHLFCRPCILYLLGSTRCCPYDNHPINETDPKNLQETNPAVYESLGRIAVRCLFHKSGCAWQGQLVESAAHSASCGYGNSAVFCNRCGVQIMHRQVQEHAQTCTGTMPQAQPQPQPQPQLQQQLTAQHVPAGHGPIQTLDNNQLGQVGMQGVQQYPGVQGQPGPGVQQIQQPSGAQVPQYATGGQEQAQLQPVLQQQIPPSADPWYNQQYQQYYQQHYEQYQQYQQYEQYQQQQLQQQQQQQQQQLQQQQQQQQQQLLQQQGPGAPPQQLLPVPQSYQLQEPIPQQPSLQQQVHLHQSMSQLQAQPSYPQQPHPQQLHLQQPPPQQPHLQQPHPHQPHQHQPHPQQPHLQHSHPQQLHPQQPHPQQPQLAQPQPQLQPPQMQPQLLQQQQLLPPQHQQQPSAMHPLQQPSHPWEHPLQQQQQQQHQHPQQQQMGWTQDGNLLIGHTMGQVQVVQDPNAYPQYAGLPQVIQPLPAVQQNVPQWQGQGLPGQAAALAAHQPQQHGFPQAVQPIPNSAYLAQSNQQMQMPQQSVRQAASHPPSNHPAPLAPSQPLPLGGQGGQPPKTGSIPVAQNLNGPARSQNGQPSQVVEKVASGQQPNKHNQQPSPKLQQDHKNSQAHSAVDIKQPVKASVPAANESATSLPSKPQQKGDDLQGDNAVPATQGKQPPKEPTVSKAGPTAQQQAQPSTTENKQQPPSSQKEGPQIASQDDEHQLQHQSPKQNLLQLQHQSPRQNPHQLQHQSPRQNLHQLQHQSPRQNLHQLQHQSPLKNLHQLQHQSPRQKQAADSHVPQTQEPYLSSLPHMAGLPRPRGPIQPPQGVGGFSQLQNIPLQMGPRNHQAEAMPGMPPSMHPRFNVYQNQKLTLPGQAGPAQQQGFPQGFLNDQQPQRRPDMFGNFPNETQQSPTTSRAMSPLTPSLLSGMPQKGFLETSKQAALVGPPRAEGPKPMLLDSSRQFMENMTAMDNDKRYGRFAEAEKHFLARPDDPFLADAQLKAQQRSMARSELPLPQPRITEGSPPRAPPELLSRFPPNGSFNPLSMPSRVPPHPSMGSFPPDMEGGPRSGIPSEVAAGREFPPEIGLRHRHLAEFGGRPGPPLEMGPRSRTPSDIGAHLKYPSDATLHGPSPDMGPRSGPPLDIGSRHGQAADIGSRPPFQLDSDSHPKFPPDIEPRFGLPLDMEHRPQFSMDREPRPRFHVDIEPRPAFPIEGRSRPVFSMDLGAQTRPHPDLLRERPEGLGPRPDFLGPRLDFRGRPDPMGPMHSPRREHTSLPSRRESGFPPGWREPIGLSAHHEALHGGPPFHPGPEVGRDALWFEDPRMKALGLHPNTLLHDPLNQGRQLHLGARVHPLSAPGPGFPHMPHGPPHGFLNGGPYFKPSQVNDESEPLDFGRKRKQAGSSGWCRICHIDCYTVEGLQEHSQSEEHRKKTLDLVMSIKQDSAKKQKHSSSVADEPKSSPKSSPKSTPENGNDSRRSSFDEQGSDPE